MLDIIKNDPWLKPFSRKIEDRNKRFLKKEKELTQNGKITLSDFATGYLYFDYTKPLTDGYSANGRRTLPKFFSSVRSITGNGWNRTG